MKNLSKELIKKKFGRFYTPQKIVELMVSEGKYQKESKILEPGFGDGRFIEAIFKKYIKLDVNKDVFLKNNMYGIETDKNAYEKISIKYSASENIVLKSFFTEVFENQKFDIIIGNPPYAAHMNEKEIEYCHKNYDLVLKDKKNGRIESAAMFVAKSISLLKRGGHLIFIIPSTLLRIYTFLNLRKEILRECYVKKIINVGRAFPDVGYEMVILILEKKGLNKEPENVKISNQINNINDEWSIKYNFFKSRSIFPMWIRNTEEKLVRQIEKETTKLRNIATMPRGLPITATNQKYISNNPSKGKQPVLRGKDITKYRIKGRAKYILWPIKQYEKYKSRFVDKKILVQNLAYRIVGAIDYDSFLCLDTLNIIKLNNRKYIYEYIIAVLNSDLMEYYFQNLITNRARLNIHLDEPYLGEIPIKNIGLKKQKEFIPLVQNAGDSNKQDEFHKINEKIIQIYDLNKPGYKEIIRKNRLSSKKN